LAEDLTRHYRVALKEESLIGTLRHFLRRRYQTVRAVEGVSFRIEPGEVVGFLGPNGAGKTTTLKMLTGLVHPTRGRALVAGHVPQRREKAFLKKITLVMGNKQQLIWDLPAMDSFRLNAAIYEVPEGEFRKRVLELAEMLSLTERLHQPVRKLSLGERMKAELLAALLHRPEVLFLDEPTLGLDVNAQVAVQGVHPRVQPPLWGHGPPHQPLHGRHRRPLPEGPGHPPGEASLRRGHPYGGLDRGRPGRGLPPLIGGVRPLLPHGLPGAPGHGGLGGVGV
jgi:ABC-type Na+ transport system ATPase subunit NatA